MKYAVKTNTCANCNSFSDAISIFSQRFLNSPYEEDGLNYLYEFGEYVENIKFPCDKIVLNPFSGQRNLFSFSLQFNGECVLWMEIEMKEFGLQRINNFVYYKQDLRGMFHSKIEKYFDNFNSLIFDEHINICGINKSSNDINIVLDYYRDYNKTDKQVTLNGSLADIFSKFTSMNETLKYCNGDYYEFAEKNIEKLYGIFVSSCKGNYFLMNAVKDGRLID